MRLRRAQIQNYRSIVDSGVVNIEEVVTVLIGRNEQGKTNFLKGLASFAEKHRYDPGEFPKHLRPKLEGLDASGIPIVTLWLAPDPREMEKLKEIVPETERVAEFRVVRTFDNQYTYEVIRTDGESVVLELSTPDISQHVEALNNETKSLGKKLKAHGERVPEFATAQTQVDQHISRFLSSRFDDGSQVDNLIKTFATALKGLPGQDKPIQQDIAAAMKVLQANQEAIRQLFQSDPVASFRQFLPSFVLHSASLDQIPNEVSIAQFVGDPDGTSRGMANLCGVAGLSTQKIQELAGSAETSEREAYEDHYRASISGGINEFWTQAQYNVHFRIDRDKLSVSISDDNYAPRIPPTDRSDGFQWYLSFYAALLNESGSTSNTVVLLDNPGLELHADGQRDIKRFLEEKLSSTTQVIYVTHSPAMIDAFNLEQVRKVELMGNQQGTKVTNWTFKEGEHSDLLEPVRSAVGSNLVTSLMFNDYNVLVEGAADKLILEGALSALRKDETRSVLVNGSVAESKNGFLPRFYERAKLPFVVLLDGDSSGRRLANQLKNWGIPEEKILNLEDVFPERKGHDFELEDIVSADFYHKAVTETYPERTVEQPTQIAGKRVKQYEEMFRENHDIGFNKRRVATTAKALLLRGAFDDGTRENLEKVLAALLDALAKQHSGDRAAE